MQVYCLFVAVHSKSITLFSHLDLKHIRINVVVVYTFTDLTEQQVMVFNSGAVHWTRAGCFVGVWPRFGGTVSDWPYCQCMYILALSICVCLGGSGRKNPGSMEGRKMAHVSAGRTHIIISHIPHDTRSGRERGGLGRIPKGFHKLTTK